MIRKNFLLIVCLVLVLAACSETVPSAVEQPRAWFDMPLPETVFYPPNPCRVVAHGASPAGIDQFALSVDGGSPMTLSITASEEGLAVLDVACPDLHPGRNILSLQARDTAGSWSEYADTTVILAEERAAPAETPLPSATAPTVTASPEPRTLPSLTPSPTLTVTSTSGAPESGYINIERVSTNIVYVGSSSCGPMSATVSVRAMAPKGITVVVLFYRIQAEGSSTEYTSLAMNPAGDDQYQGAINPTSALGGSAPFDQATLQYQVVVQQTDGDVSLRTPLRSDIAVLSCGSGAPEPPPPSPSCSSYTDQRNCIANGCRWVEIPGIRPVFACQGP